MIKLSLLIHFMSIRNFKKFKSIFVPLSPTIRANLTLICILCITMPSYSQENAFSAAVITDLNFSQIRGDMLAGYHRLGFGAGVGVSYRFYPRWNGHVELLYRNVGSRNSPFSPDRLSIDLHMAQIPVYASYQTWWDNGLSRIQFDLGMIYGRVVNSRVRFPQYEAHQSSINQNDYSLLAGMGFWFTHHHGIRMRYHRSLSLLLNEEEVKWQLYYISLQYLYRF